MLISSISGLSFPIGLSSGSTVLMTGIELLRNDILNLLNHRITERYFAGQYGVKFWDQIEQPNDNVTLALVREFTIEALNLYETRIKLLAVNTTVSNEKIYVQLKYIILELALEDSFIFTI